MPGASVVAFASVSSTATGISLPLRQAASVMTRKPSGSRIPQPLRGEIRQLNALPGDIVEGRRRRSGWRRRATKRARF